MEFVGISDCDLSSIFPISLISPYFSISLLLAYVSFQLDSSSFSNGWIFSLLGRIFFSFSPSQAFLFLFLTAHCQCVSLAWPCLLSYGCSSSLFLFSKVVPHLLCCWMHFPPFCIPGIRGFGQALQHLPQGWKKGWSGGGRLDQRSHLSLGEVLGSASLCEQRPARRDARIYWAGYDRESWIPCLSLALAA